MIPNLLEGFSDWLKSNINQNIDMGDFAQIGNTFRANITLTTSSGEKVKFPYLTEFEVWSNSDGSVFKLIVKGSKNSNSGYGSASPHEGKVFTLNKKSFEQLQLYPRNPQANMGGGMM